MKQKTFSGLCLTESEGSIGTAVGYLTVDWIDDFNSSEGGEMEGTVFSSSGKLSISGGSTCIVVGC